MLSGSSVEIARRENGRVVVRPGIARLRWEWIALTSSDGHSISAVFRASVRPLDDPAERRLLEETFLGQSSAVGSADVAAYFSTSLEAAARRQIGAVGAESLLSDASRSSICGQLADTARGLAFACGLECTPPFELELSSPTLAARQEESRRAAAQSERLGKAATVFKQFNEFRASAPELSTEQILSRIGGADPAEQTELLRALLLAAAAQSDLPSLWAVAGPHLLKIEPEKREAAGNAQPVGAPKIFSPPSALGPFRSVGRAALEGNTVLLIGAQSGVLIVDPQSPDEATLYADPANASQLGFNGAVLFGSQLWAAHGESGLFAWDLDKPGHPAVAVRPASSSIASLSPRNLCVLNGNRLLFSSDRRLMEATADGQIQIIDASAAPIVALIPSPGRDLLVVHEDGQICRRDGATLAVIARSHRTGRVTAAGAMPWLGSIRLLVASEQPSLLCLGMDDEWVTQYVTTHVGLRRAAAAADRVAAVNADRQRILLWPSWDGRKPPVEIHVAALARHRVADIEFA